MCDETQNLNEIESKTFFRYQFFPIPNPILFSKPRSFETEMSHSDGDGDDNSDCTSLQK